MYSSETGKRWVCGCCRSGHQSVRADILSKLRVSRTHGTTPQKQQHVEQVGICGRAGQNLLNFEDVIESLKTCANARLRHHRSHRRHYIRQVLRQKIHSALFSSYGNDGETGYRAGCVTVAAATTTHLASRAFYARKGQHPPLNNTESADVRRRR